MSDEIRTPTPETLAAAAKDLYEALAHLVDAQNGPPLMGRHQVFWEHAMALASKALAKAEGRE